MKKLLPIYYGELEFILRYVAAGSLFQWVYVGRNGPRDLRLISPRLDLTHFNHRCKFYLSLGYAYHLMCSMVDAIPKVQNDYAMFSRDENGDRAIVFYPNYIRKSVKKFKSYCNLVGTTVDAARRAYVVSAGCPILPQLISDEVRRSGTYCIKYRPIGCPHFGV